MHRMPDQLPLRRGSHAAPTDGLCAMELVAWYAGEAHSDGPQCACPVIAAFVRAVNDALPTDTLRDRLLRPMVPALAGSRGTALDERRRGFAVASALVREFLPHALATRGHVAEALQLHSLPPVVDAASARRALREIDAMGLDVRAARWLLQRAAEGAAPAGFVGAAVQVLRLIGGQPSWQLLARTVQEMLAPAPADTAVEALG